MKNNTKPNKLINSASPYLLQHAYNPVDWNPWSDEAFNRARREDKPVLISIGYSACHWCHVMEHESFENNSIAEIMNRNFICIKVDREERPDVDSIYMDAIHALGMNGGWPMNVFTTPDQKPFYGGTYFPPERWKLLLENINNAWNNDKENIIESADALTEAISRRDDTEYAAAEIIRPDITGLSRIAGGLKPHFDKSYGGITGAPKFPMPSIWHFLLKSGSMLKDDEILKQVEHTLDAMSAGGINDQLGGGFSRYSVDERWFAPHFEKMLYDNGQMLSLYSDAWRFFKKDEYKKTVYRTAEFILRELQSPESGFYSALDADSEGVEGKFYVWSYDEIQAIADKDAELFMDFYNVSKKGNWEHGNNILYRDIPLNRTSEKSGMSESELSGLLNRVEQKLRTIRSERIRPGLDDKIIAGWNGLVLKGLCDAYNAFNDDLFLNAAASNASFIKNRMIQDGRLYRNYKNNLSYTDGSLEDYALVIQGFISLYQTGFDEAWLREANSLCRYVLEHFADTGNSFLYFTDINSEKLITRKKEIFDNVIPSSNSVMASNFYLMGRLLSDNSYIDISDRMLRDISALLDRGLQFMSNWAGLYFYRSYPTAEIAICGPELKKFKTEIEKEWIPNKITAGSLEPSSLPLLNNRIPANGATKIYICSDNTCGLPADTVKEALSKIRFS
jgi:hypothetical protein